MNRSLDGIEYLAKDDQIFTTKNVQDVHHNLYGVKPVDQVIQ